MNSLFNIERNLHRKIIGYLGIITPLILVLGSWAFGCSTVQESISAYYHTVVQHFFLWIVIIIGIFFLAYPILENYEADKKPFRIAGIMALFVAFFPTNLKSITNCTIHSSTFGNYQIAGYIHNIAAAAFFLILAYICVFLFTKSDKSLLEISDNKKTCNRFYRFAGFTILTCIVLIIIYEFWGREKFPELKEFKLVFILESIALLFFGLAYLIKGELFLKKS